MKPTSTAAMNKPKILAIGAHPDDIEFGCGGILLKEKKLGSEIHLAVCSKGESGTFGTPEIREQETQAAADMLNASLTFLEMGGDAHIDSNAQNAKQIAALIREIKPDWLLAPAGYLNQHPDHRNVSLIVRDASRIARYGKVAGLENPPHAIKLLAFYDIVMSDSQPEHPNTLRIDISEIEGDWEKLMACHESQVTGKNYIQLQQARARYLGGIYGVSAVQTLYTESPLAFQSLQAISDAQTQKF